MHRQSYSSTSGHGPEQLRVNLNHFLDRLRSDPVSGRGTRISRHDDATLKTKRERRSTVSNLDGAVGVAAVVRHCAEP